MMARKLGDKNALMVIHAFEKNPKHFGFIKTTVKDLSELISLYSPPSMPYHSDVFSFRAGVWMVIIVSHGDWIEVTLANPYDLNEHYTVSSLD